MIKLLKLGLFLSGILLLIIGCSDNNSELIDESHPQLSFRIQQVNSENDYSSIVKHSIVKYRTSSWLEGADGNIELWKGISFEVELMNGEIIQLAFNLNRNGTPKEQLILKDEDLNYWVRAWDFKSFNVEADNFYRGFGYAFTEVNYSSAIFHSLSDGSFEVINVEPAMVNGVEKSVVTIKFKGEAFGYYDPKGEILGWYKISDGLFKGIIE